MRKKLLICDGCGKEHPGELSDLPLRLSTHFFSDITYDYDFCSYECLGRWIGHSSWKKHIEEGMNDDSVSKRSI